MSLGEQIKTLSGNRRKFFLLRVADMGTREALKLCGVVRGTYNTWLQNSEFVDLYRQRGELSGEFRQEAIQLLRRDNQLETVLLESKILLKMKADLECDFLPDGSILRTNLAREVYSKLMSELDAPPPAVALTWAERLQQIITIPPNQIAGTGEVVSGEFVETVSEPSTEH